MKQRFQRIAGVDEAGRGPLAGPVVAAACAFPEGFYIEGIDDSKKLDPQTRFRLYQELIQHPDIDYGIGIIDSLIIDEINILQATFRAMVLAVESLKVKPDHLLVDGPHLPKPFKGWATPLIKGDSLEFCISAASIIAKETRDQIMRNYHQEWPEYGFNQHKGYGTPQHREALSRLGPCPIHRQSFTLS